MAGFRKFSRSRGTSSKYRRVSSSRRGGFKKTRSGRLVVKPRFAVTGYLKDTEKKYADISLVSVSWLPQTISYETTPGLPSSLTVQGVKFMSNMRRATNFPDASQNLVSWVSQGTTAGNRIGNKITGKWLDLGITLEAAKSPVNQQGEQVNPEGSVTTAQYYMKTNYRIVIVKDLQVNNSTNTCEWKDVFGTGDGGSDITSFGANDKLDIPNMGRFIIVKDVRCSVDAVNPMKNINMGCYPGQIRFNSASYPALTSKGYYLLIAQDVLGSANSLSYVIPGNVRCTSRLTFTDD